MDPQPYALICGIGGVLSAVAVWGTMRCLRRKRLLQNLPTSKVQGVFMGLVELKGTAEAERPLTSYLLEAACVHYSYTIEEHWSRWETETYTDSKGRMQTRLVHRSGWTTVGTGGQMIPFYLKDDTGIIRVLPQGAKIDTGYLLYETCGTTHPLYYGKGPQSAIGDSDYRRRFVENGIRLHDQLYIVGRAREREDIVAPEIAQDDETPIYLISTKTEASVTSRLGWWSWLWGLLGLILWLGGIIFAGSSGPCRPEEHVPFYIGMASIYFGVLIAGWIWMVFNSVINLRQRVRQAWSLVEVQLKRRHDLIPNLIKVVEELRDHESDVQEGLVRMRVQLEATEPGEQGPDPEGLVGVTRTLMENYPELKAQSSFLDLQEQLIDTEQRIALARSYYNEISTHYNNRLEIIPDRFVARLAKLKPRRLIVATDFERAPVKVNLTSA